MNKAERRTYYVQKFMHSDCVSVMNYYVKPTREYKYKSSNDDYIFSYYEYKECCADEELDDLFLIREDDGEWRESLVEVEE